MDSKITMHVTRVRRAIKYLEQIYQTENTLKL